LPIRKPPSRTLRTRASDNDPRRLSEANPSQVERAQLAARARFGAYAKHKKHPDAYGLKPYEGNQEDTTYCDEHAGFCPGDMPRAPELLRRGIEAGLFGKTIKKGDPGLLWSVDDNGWIYEAQITNPGFAEYHAYPVLPNEAIARKVLMRYADYVLAVDDPMLTASLDAAQRLYR
jgi:hypothetical protein